MPRKTKELDVKDEEIKKSSKSVSSKPVKNSKTTKTSTAKKEKKVGTTTRTAKTTSSNKATKTTKKSASAKSTTKSSTKVASIKSTKTSTKKGTRKVTSKAKSSSKEKVLEYTPEYYDLPYRYNQTIVTILAQTPNSLFVYWDISDSDRQSLKDKYGEYFFEITKPVLIVINETMKYSFEVDINDFANSWYIHINNSDCEYKIELGRRPIPVNYSYIPNYNIEEKGPILPIETPYIYISSSNEIITPNDKILFNLKQKIKFRNIKNNDIIEKDISDFPHIYKDGKFINIYKLFKYLYQDKILGNKFDFSNPSSGNPGSGSFLIRFK